MRRTFVRALVCHELLTAAFGARPSVLRDVGEHVHGGASEAVVSLPDVEPLIVDTPALKNTSIIQTEQQQEAAQVDKQEEEETEAEETEDRQRSTQEETESQEGRQQRLESSAASMLRSMDLDKDGQVSLEELLENRAQDRHADPKDLDDDTVVITGLLQDADTDGNGRLNQDEMLKLAGAVDDMHSRVRREESERKAGRDEGPVSASLLEEEDEEDDDEDEEEEDEEDPIESLLESNLAPTDFLEEEEDDDEGESQDDGEAKEEEDDDEEEEDDEFFDDVPNDVQPSEIASPNLLEVGEVDGETQQETQTQVAEDDEDCCDPTRDESCNGRPFCDDLPSPPPCSMVDNAPRCGNGDTALCGYQQYDQDADGNALKCDCGGIRGCPETLTHENEDAIGMALVQEVAAATAELPADSSGPPPLAPPPPVAAKATLREVVL